jgi:hypothetical protein
MYSSAPYKFSNDKNLELENGGKNCVISSNEINSVNKDNQNVNFSSNSKELSLSSPAKFSTTNSNKNRRVKQLENILSSKIINFTELKKQAWKGIPFGKLMSL